MAQNDGPDPGVAQFALSTSDMPRATQLYCDVLGCLKAGGLVIWGDFLARLQRVPDPAAALWWLIDRQDFVQLEIWGYTRPVPRPLPLDWRPCDIGYTRMTFHVDDFDGVLARLPTMGLSTMTDPRGPDGDRRVCFRDHDGFIIELNERDPIPDARPPRWPESGCAVRSVSLSVPDLDKARRFWVETLALEVIDASLLHTPAMEELWGLPAARAETLLLRAGDQLIELQQYHDPAPRPRPDGYLLSDVGILNIALGYRTRDAFSAAFTRLLDNGYTANVMPNDEGPFTSSYVNDDQGFSLEIFHCAPEVDQFLGFMPESTWRSATGRPPRAPSD